jgi:uncharacterized protein YpmS
LKFNNSRWKRVMLILIIILITLKILLLITILIVLQGQEIYILEGNLESRIR